MSLNVVYSIFLKYMVFYVWVIRSFFLLDNREARQWNSYLNYDMCKLGGEHLWVYRNICASCFTRALVKLLFDLVRGTIPASSLKEYFSLPVIFLQGCSIFTSGNIWYMLYFIIEKYHWSLKWIWLQNRSSICSYYSRI